MPPDVGVLAVEVLPISGRVTTYPLAPTPEFCDMVVSCIAQQRGLAKSDWNDFVLIGDSYGTMLTAGLLRHPGISHRIAACVLIDPVSLMLHLPDVAYNFARRKPRPSIRGRPGHGNEWEIWWGSARDAETAHALARRMCWRESVLFREEETQYQEPGRPQVGMRSTVILGSEDCVTHPKAVAQYVTTGTVEWNTTDIEAWKNREWTGRDELELVYLDGKDHGQGIMVPRPDARIAKVILEFCRRDDDFPTPDLEPSESAEAEGAGAPDVPSKDS